MSIRHHVLTAKKQLIDLLINSIYCPNVANGGNIGQWWGGATLEIIGYNIRRWLNLTLEGEGVQCQKGRGAQHRRVRGSNIGWWGIQHWRVNGSNVRRAQNWRVGRPNIGGLGDPMLEGEGVQHCKLRGSNIGGWQGPMLEDLIIGGQGDPMLEGGGTQCQSVGGPNVGGKGGSNIGRLGGPILEGGGTQCWRVAGPNVGGQGDKRTTKGLLIQIMK